ncbi:MAG: sugar phosphate isomerase/epimerase [Clostridia bacterium]|nr:sugar phosphate isomerase/epimerase [Clostridia bacterium]
MFLSITSDILSDQDAVLPEKRLIRAMELCRGAGFRYIDLNFATHVQPGFPMAAPGWERWADAVGETAARLGVSFRQSHSFVYRTRESTDMTIDRARYDERIRRSIRAAARLGVEWLVMHAADFDADPDYDFDKARRYNLNYWQPFIDLAAREGVGIAFENLFASGCHRRYCSTAEELIDLAEGFRTPLVGVCWDTGHAAVAGQNQPAAIRLIGSLLKCTHIHDNHCRPKEDEHLIPYYGSIDWPPILKTLAEIGYAGNFSLEIKQATRPLPEAVCGDMLRFLNALGREMIRQTGKEQ